MAAIFLIAALRANLDDWRYATNSLGSCFGWIYFVEHLRFIRGSNSVVECNLAKVEVEGSNPFSRSMIFAEAAYLLRYALRSFVRRYYHSVSAVACACLT